VATLALIPAFSPEEKENRLPSESNTCGWTGRWDVGNLRTDNGSSLSACPSPVGTGEGVRRTGAGCGEKAL